MKQIVAVYDAEAKRIENDKPVDTIELEPFTVQYEKKDESDVPFTLTSPEKIVL